MDEAGLLKVRGGMLAAAAQVLKADGVVEALTWGGGVERSREKSS